MGFYAKLIIFIVINFGALWLGSLLQGAGSRSEWYQGLEIAPWTPPGWVFGAAWFSIMLCFAVFMAYTVDLKAFNLLLLLLIIQLVLNIGWNAVFFRYHLTGLSLIIILALTIVVTAIFFMHVRTMPAKSLLVLPYVLWLLLATSLNWYAWIKN